MPIIILGLLLLNVLEASKNRRVAKLNKVCTVIASDVAYDTGISEVIRNLNIEAIPQVIIARLNKIMIRAFFFKTKSSYI